MKKKSKSSKNWKFKKRISFHVYFVIFATIIVTVSTSIPTVVYAVINEILGTTIVIPELLIISISSFLVGVILSIFTGKILLAPFKKLKHSMERVAAGDFDVSIDVNSMFDEVEDMYHYFNLMVNELKATETIQSDFVSNVSHEFKTPLTAIEGYATLLTDKDLTDEEKDLYVNKILFNTNRMSQLVNNVLLLSKLDNQAISKEYTNFSLDEQIRQSVLFLEEKWTKKNIEFDVDFPEISYFGMESLLIHVWTNLISNAIKFSKENSIIQMILTTDGKYLTFQIKDSGPGVKEENMEHIFIKFFQADQSRKEEGYGLGLPLAKKIVDLHHGEISVSNDIAGGAIFTVKLPVNK